MATLKSVDIAAFLVLQAQKNKKINTGLNRAKNVI
jgi:hypothetical protein